MLDLTLLLIRDPKAAASRVKSTMSRYQMSSMILSLISIHLLVSRRRNQSHSADWLEIR
jgi:hypothetical protein